jgi:hypothetical protein
MSRWLLLSFVVTGCAAAAYNYVPTTSQSAAARPAGCGIDVLTARPDRPFVELGVLEWGIPTNSVAAFRTAVRPKVCAAGGDAVLAEVNGNGTYVRGTVLRYRGADASPHAAEKQVPPNQGATSL